MCITRSEGFQGFYRGLSPSLLLTAPQTGFQFAFYKLANDLMSASRARFTSQRQDAESSRRIGTQLSITFSFYHVSHDYGILLGVVQSVVAGAIAGVSSKCIVYPMDVAKKRLQVQVINGL